MAYLRTAEAVGIGWQHLDLEAGVLTVRQSNWRGKLLTVKSKASNRDLPLPPVLVEMLREYRPRWRANALGLLFSNAKGNPITSCSVRRDILHPVRERLGIPRGGFHAFRHGLGTALMQGGANPRVVQAQLGHADLRMLQRYAHVVSADPKKRGRTHNRSLFAAFCGELNRQVVKNKLSGWRTPRNDFKPDR